MNRIAVVLALFIAGLGNLGVAQVSIKSASPASAAATTTTLSASPSSPAVLGTPVTLTATVTPGFPTGTVTFYDGVNVLGSAPVSSNTAALKTINLGAGPHSLIAHYNGAAGAYETSASNPQSFAVTANPGGSFSSTSINSPNGPVSVAYGDFNGDGIPDLVVANENANTVSVFLGNGNGTFQAPVAYAVGTTPVAVAVADVNEDGFPDIVVANQSSSTLTILLGAGDGTFPNSVVSKTIANPHAIVIADFNGDGAPDIAVTSNNTDDVQIKLNQGAGVFGAGVNYGLTGAGKAVIASDFNGDGFADLAVVNSLGSLYYVSVLLGNGDGTLQPAVNYTVGPNPLAVASADFNGDGLPDLAVVNSQSSTVSILLNLGSGLFGPQTAYPTAPTGSTGAVGLGPNAIVISDFNGDGIPDIATTDYSGSDVSLLLGKGDGTFPAAETTVTTVGTGPRALLVTDLNDDGIADLVVADFTANTLSILLGSSGSTTTLTASPNPQQPGGTVTLTATVSPNNATGEVTFYNGLIDSGDVIGVATLAPGTSTTPPTAIYPASGLSDGSHVITAVYSGNATVAGSTSKPVTELIAPTTTTTLTATPNPQTLGQPVTLTASVSPNSAAGKFTFYNGTTVLGQATGKLGTASFKTALLPAGTNVLTAEFQGDADYLPSVSPSVTVTMNATGPAGFQAPISYSAGSGTTAMVVGDFNNDGLADVAVANYASNNISVLLNQGSGVFETAKTTNAGPNPKALVAADFNGDGKLDLAICDNADTTGTLVVVLLNNGNGTFAQASGSPVQVGLAPTSIAAADVNGDGIPDLIVLDSGSGQISVLLGVGNGTFQPATFISVAGGLTALTTGDFNGDGKVDVAVTGGNGVYILLGNGDGTFATAVAYNTGFVPAAVVSAYLGNGTLDLVVVNSGAGSNNVSVLIGNGDGTFQTAVNYPVGNFPVAVTLGDFNGDGKLDVAVANEADNTVSVLYGNGNGTLQTALTYPAGTTPDAIASASFDATGQSDIAVADYQTGTVSILLGLKPSTTSLTATPNPDSTGGPITLTASVFPAFATGTVSFFDGTNNIGIVPLINAQASTTVSLSAGNHSLTAVYNGSSSYGVSTSAAVSESVSQAVSTTTVTATPSPAKYGQKVTLTATIAGGETPTGEVTFYSGGASIIGSAALSSGTALYSTTELPSGVLSVTARYAGDSNNTASLSSAVQLLVNPQHSYGLGAPSMSSAGTAPSSVTVADFNGDGFADLAVADSGSTAGVSVLLGNGNGTFQAASFQTAGAGPIQVVTADFNLDGIPDLAVANAGSSNVSILLGTGNGTFQTAVNYPAGLSPSSVAVADFNNDGKPDLVVANRGSASLSILLGNGDGTFGTTQSVSVGATDAFVVAGDFNGDGNADLAVADLTGNTVWILLGNGNGTFQAPVSATGTNPYTGTNPAYIAVGNFNFDSSLDLAVVNQGSNNVTVLLGNGNGTFTVSGPFPAGTGANSIAVGDFNGDGIPDLGVTAGQSGSLEVLIGNGNGTFQSPLAFTGFSDPVSVATGNFNGDGTVQPAVADQVANTVGVLLDTQPTITTVQGNSQTTSVGSNFAYPLEVLVTGFGSPVPGASVVFTAPSSGPSGIFTGLGASYTVATGSLGTATTPVFTANNVAGSYSVTAAIGSSSVGFSLTNSTVAGCAITPGSSSVAVDKNGGAVQIPVTASLPSCAWGLASDSSWITVGGSGGTGSGTAPLTIAANTTGVARLGHVYIGGQTIPVTEDATAQVFADVPPSAFYFDAVNLLYAKGITSGCSTNPLDYCPDESITRAQTAIFMVTAVYGGSNFTYSPTPWFTDVPAGSFGFAYIQKFYELGITSGCGTNLFCPNEVITRDQMAVFLIKMQLGANTVFDYNPVPYFTDVPASYWAFPWIQRLAQEQITAGCAPNLYCPGAAVNRADMAIFIMEAAFNQLLPAGTPIISSVSPSTLLQGSNTITVTGVNTNFVQGETAVNPISFPQGATPGATVSFGVPTVTSPTSFTVVVTVTGAEQAPYIQPEPLFVITGTQEAVLPNALTMPN